MSWLKCCVLSVSRFLWRFVSHFSFCLVGTFFFPHNDRFLQWALFFFTRIFYKFISHTILPRMRANRKISSVVDRKSRGPSGLRCRMVFSDYRTSTWSAVVDRKSRGSNWLRCRLVFNAYRTCTLRAVVGPKSRGAERALAQSVFQRLPCSVRLPVKSHAGLASFGAAWRPALCTPSCDDNKQLRWLVTLLIVFVLSSDDESGSHSKFGRMDEDNMQDKERFAR